MSRTVHVLAVLSAAACLTAGCSGQAARRPEPAAPQPAHSPAVQSTAVGSAEQARYAYGFTTRQQEFLEAIHRYPKEVGDSSDQLLVDTARDFCGQTGDDEPTAYSGYGSPPRIDGIIEHKHRIGVLERLAVRHMCPKYAGVLRRGLAGFTEGEHPVGPKGIKPGTYRTTEREVRRCYWERATPGGDTIANKFITYAAQGVTVTIQPGDGAFISRGCGNWAPPA